jgi:hypothetical protein
VTDPSAKVSLPELVKDRVAYAGLKKREGEGDRSRQNLQAQRSGCTDPTGEACLKQGEDGNSCFIYSKSLLHYRLHRATADSLVTKMQRPLSSLLICDDAIRAAARRFSIDG